MKYWIFQGRTDMYDFDSPIIIEDWGVKRFKNEIKEGDKGIIWLTGNKAGCYALVDVISDPDVFGISIDNPRWKDDNKLGREFKQNDNTQRKVKIKIYGLFKNPLLRKDIKTGLDLKTITGLEQLHVGAGYIGTNFSLQPKEYEIIANLVRGR